MPALLNMLGRLLGPDKIKDAADWSVGLNWGRLIYFISVECVTLYRPSEGLIHCCIQCQIHTSITYKLGSAKEEVCFQQSSREEKRHRGVSIHNEWSAATLVARWLSQYEQITIFHFLLAMPSFHYHPRPAMILKHTYKLHTKNFFLMVLTFTDVGALVIIIRTSAKL